MSEPIVLDDSLFKDVEIPPEFKKEPEKEAEPEKEPEKNPETKPDEKPEKEPEKEPENEPGKEPQKEELKDSKPDRTVPLTEFLKERKKWQDKIKAMEGKVKIADDLASMTGKTYDEMVAEMEAIKAKKFVDDDGNPIPEKYAKRIMELEQKSQSEALQAKEQAISAEIDALKANPLYAGVELYRDEVMEFAKKHGVPAKQAYHALYGDTIVQDMETTIEQRVLANLQKKQSAKLDTAGAKAEQKQKIDLTNEEIEFAKMAGLTPQEYYKAKHSTSYADYQKG